MSLRTRRLAVVAAVAGLLQMGMQSSTAQQPQSELSRQLEAAYLGNVQPLLVTLTLRELDPERQELVTHDVVRVSTAVAVFSGTGGTFWLTIPAAFEQDELGKTLLNTRFQLADGAVLELFKQVDDRYGYYAVLLERAQRQIAPIQVATRVNRLDRAGAIMAVLEDEVLALQTTPWLSNSTSSFRFIRGPEGFAFALGGPTPDSARGAPAFLYRLDPFERPDQPFLLGGLLMDVHTARAKARGLSNSSGEAFAVTLPPCKSC